LETFYSCKFHLTVEKEFRSSDPQKAESVTVPTTKLLQRADIEERRGKVSPEYETIKRIRQVSLLLCTFHEVVVIVAEVVVVLVAVVVVVIVAEVVVVHSSRSSSSTSSRSSSCT